MIKSNSVFELICYPHVTCAAVYLNHSIKPRAPFDWRLGRQKKKGLQNSKEWLRVTGHYCSVSSQDSILFGPLGVIYIYTFVDKMQATFKFWCLSNNLVFQNISEYLRFFGVSETTTGKSLCLLEWSNLEIYTPKKKIHPSIDLASILNNDSRGGLSH